MAEQAGHFHYATLDEYQGCWAIGVSVGWELWLLFATGMVLIVVAEETVGYYESENHDIGNAQSA